MYFYNTVIMRIGVILFRAENFDGILLGGFVGGICAENNTDKAGDDQ